MPIWPTLCITTYMEVVVSDRLVCRVVVTKNVLTVDEEANENVEQMQGQMQTEHGKPEDSCKLQHIRYNTVHGTQDSKTQYGR